MNACGKRLSRAEAFSALHAHTSDVGLPPSFEDIAQRIDDETGFGRIDDDTVLLAFLARRGPDVTRDIRQEFESASGEREIGRETRQAAYDGALASLRAAVAFLQRDADIPHFTFLPYRFLLVVLARFFAHHPNPHPQNARLLRRWTWRAAMAGPAVGKGSATGAMRMYASRIVQNDETSSVQGLLAAVGDERPKLTFPGAFRSKDAATRIVLCALWSHRPRCMRSGEPYDASQLADALRDRSTASEATGLLVPGAPGARTEVGNRVILLGDATDEEAALRLRVRPAEMADETWSELLDSHLMSRDLAARLEDGDVAAALRQRRERIAEQTFAFLERRSELDFEDTPPLDDLVLDDVEAQDDAA